MQNVEGMWRRAETGAALDLRQNARRRKEAASGRRLTYLGKVSATVRKGSGTGEDSQRSRCMSPEMLSKEKLQPLSSLPRA